MTNEVERIQVAIPAIPDEFALIMALDEVVGHFIKNREMNIHKAERAVEYYRRELEAR